MTGSREFDDRDRKRSPWPSKTTCGTPGRQKRHADRVPAGPEPTDCAFRPAYRNPTCPLAVVGIGGLHVAVLGTERITQMRLINHRVMLDRVQALARKAMENVEVRGPPAAAAGESLRPDELRALEHCPERLLASISRALSHLAAAPPAVRRHVAGGASSACRCGK